MLILSRVPGQGLKFKVTKPDEIEIIIFQKKGKYIKLGIKASKSTLVERINGEGGAEERKLEKLEKMGP